MPRGLVVRLTGLSGSGKTTIARAVEDALKGMNNRCVVVLDGDEIRRHLNPDLGFLKGIGSYISRG